ncbi:hypothetical protein FACS1894219_12940 [Clostridia bacterium]|nr:hypothetical protein FACS1894219_12940 [Clostridia bacterium]
MKNLFDYLYKRVKLTTKDGRVLEDTVIDFSCALANESGEDEISFKYPLWCESFGESDIASIEIIDEPQEKQEQPHTISA